MVAGGNDRLLRCVGYSGSSLSASASLRACNQVPHYARRASMLARLAYSRLMLPFYQRHHPADSAQRQDRTEKGHEREILWPVAAIVERRGLLILE